MVKGVKRKKVVKRKEKNNNFVQYVFLFAILIAGVLLSYNRFFTGYATGDLELVTNPNEGGSTVSARTILNNTLETKEIDIGETKLISGINVTLLNVTINSSGNSSSYSATFMLGPEGPLTLTNGEFTDNLAFEDKGTVYDHFISVKLISASEFSATIEVSVDTMLHEENVRNYPSPFISGSVADVAIIYGENGSSVEAVQAGNIQSNLQAYLPEGELGNILVKDSERTYVDSKSLIIIGTPCSNSLFMDLFNESDCSLIASNVGLANGEMLIQVFENPWSSVSGKIVLVVMGYNVDDLVSAVAYLERNNISTTLGKRYLGLSATKPTEEQNVTACLNTDNSCGTYPSCNDCTATKQNFCGDDGKIYSKNQICIDNQCRWWDEFINSLAPIQEGEYTSEDSSCAEGDNNCDGDVSDADDDLNLDGMLNRDQLDARGCLQGDSNCDGDTDDPQDDDDLDGVFNLQEGVADCDVVRDRDCDGSTSGPLDDANGDGLLNRDAIDGNGDGLCEYGEGCWGDESTPAGDDGDMLCEVGESCCDINPEGCNYNNGVDGEGNVNTPDSSAEELEEGDMELTTNAILTGHITANEISRTSDPSIQLVEDCPSNPAANPSCDWLGNKVGNKFTCSSDSVTCQPIGSSVIIEDCGQVCKNGQCTCASNGEFVWTWGAGNCCSGKTNMWGVCNDCQSGGTFVWWVAGNCCSGAVWPGGWCK